MGNLQAEGFTDSYSNNQYNSNNSHNNNIGGGIGNHNSNNIISNAANNSISRSLGNPSSNNTNGSNNQNGNHSNTQNGGLNKDGMELGLDFSQVYVDGQIWTDAMENPNFLAKIQQLLLDPSFVSSIGIDNQHSFNNANNSNGQNNMMMNNNNNNNNNDNNDNNFTDAKERAINFEKILSAGSFNSKEFFHTLRPRFKEDISNTISQPVYINTLYNRLSILRAMQNRVSSYRSNAKRPLLKQPRSPPPPSTDDNSQVRMSYTMNRVCLVSLNSIVKFSSIMLEQISKNPDLLTLNPELANAAKELAFMPLLELNKMTMKFNPLVFFQDAALPVSPPEMKVNIVSSMAFASSTESSRSADKAVDDKLNSYWCSKKRPGASYWGIKLNEPTSISAVTVNWQQNFNSVFAPLEFRVQVSKNGTDYEEVARVEMEDLTNIQAATQLHVAAAAIDISYIRIQMTGYARYNDASYYGLKQVIVHRIKPDAEYLDVRNLLYKLQDWLVDVCKFSNLNSMALITNERVACASGLLSCQLRFLNNLMYIPDDVKKVVVEKVEEENEEDGSEKNTEAANNNNNNNKRNDSEKLSQEIIDATMHTIKALKDEDHNARGKLAQAVNSPHTPVKNAAFDPYEMSSSGLSLSDDNIHVRCHTASHTHAYVNCGFKEGKWAWEFLVAEDISNDESICLGAGIKPVTSSSYNSSPNLWMYRCYNGNLYRKGGQVSGVSKERTHPTDVVRIELDHDAHTLTYKINGEKDQGICFTDVTGEIFPAVSFYGSNRAVRLLAVECAGNAGPGMRYYLANDIFKRKKWEGEMACALRHGFGKVTYTHTTSYWCGTWKQDKQHGLQAWVVTDVNNKINLEETVIYQFDMDVRKRQANEKDLANALKEWDGWGCSTCNFVSRKTSEFCSLCGAVRSVQEVDGEDEEDILDSRAACVAAIMVRLARLGNIYNTPAGEQAKPQENTSKELTLPFCAEPRIEVFNSLHNMVSKHKHSLNKPNESRIVLAALRLLRTNFDKLVASHVNPEDVGITFTTQSDNENNSISNSNNNGKSNSDELSTILASGINYSDTDINIDNDNNYNDDTNNKNSENKKKRKSSSTSSTEGSLFPLRECLEQLMMESSLPKDIGQAAAEALAAGMEILYPDTHVRCNLLCNLLQSHIHRNLDTSSLGQITLLDCLLCRFGTNEGVVALLPNEENEGLYKYKRHEKIKLLLEYLFTTLHFEKTKELEKFIDGNNQGLSRQGESLPEFCDSITSLLGAYLRQLLSITASIKPTGEESCSQMILHFGVMTLVNCEKLLIDVTNNVDSGKMKPEEAESFLKGTIVFQLLPLFATSAILFSELLWFSINIVSNITKIIERLDKLNILLPEAIAADKELRLQERAMAHNRWVSKKRDEINAVFDINEHSEDISLEDGGKLIRSTSSSNQHALANVGFRTGKAAWEFKLESDSLNDECSALGAAIKPIGSSSYENCPNMWMRRSYNGQLYHGTSAGYTSMTKVHPGDTLRVEVDMDAHTLTFKKNGEDEGVAFTDIEGEIFPAVCTYRSGIEVRLVKVEAWQGNSSMLYNQNPLSLFFDSCGLPGYVRVDEYDNSFLHVDKERDESWATAFTTRGIRSGKHIWEFSVKRCSKAMIAVGVTTATSGVVAKSQLGLHENSWAWKADGTLWAHGKQVSSSYGTSKSQHLLTDGDLVSVELDVSAQTLSFSVNGKKLGVAFGPVGSGAEVNIPVVDTQFGRPFTPAISLHNYNDKVCIRPAGTLNTLALPWLFDLQKSLVSVASRIAATVSAGPKYSRDELSCEKWLKSCLFKGGLDIFRLRDCSRDLGLIPSYVSEFNANIDSTYRTQEKVVKVRDNFLNDICTVVINEETKLAAPGAICEKLFAWLNCQLSRSISKRLITAHSIALDIELAYFASLLKHTGLWIEALNFVNNESSENKIMSSNEMKKLTKKMQEIRLFLVQQYQGFKVKRHKEKQSPDLLKALTIKNQLEQAIAKPDLLRGRTNDSMISISSFSSIDGDFVNKDEMDIIAASDAETFLEFSHCILNKVSLILDFKPTLAIQYSDTIENTIASPKIIVTKNLGEDIGISDILTKINEYVFDNNAKPAQILRENFERRISRALCRRYGLHCYRNLLGSSAYNSIIIHAVRNLRKSLGENSLKIEDWDSNEKKDDNKSSKEENENKIVNYISTAHTEKHHYLIGLEGCPKCAYDIVFKEIKPLFQLVLKILEKALHDKNINLACEVLHACALDYEDIDSEFILDLNILENIRSLLSIQNLSKCVSATLVMNENNGLRWNPWPVHDVRNGLAQGTITKRIIIEHMKCAPPNLLPPRWWSFVGSSSNENDVNVIVSKFKMSEVILLYEDMVKYVTEIRKDEEMKAATADEIAKDEARRRKGVRYTYIVTASNGVGVRHLPDTRAERTGLSYKQDEIVEATYRFTMGNGQTYIKLIDGGWIFDIGVRGSYKDKPIMKCIAIEDYVAEEEEQKALRKDYAKLLQKSRHKKADEKVEVLGDNLSAYYKEIVGDPAGFFIDKINLGIESELSDVLWSDTYLTANDDHKFAPKGRVKNYYEVNVRCCGASQDICIGISGVINDIKNERQQVAIHVKDWSIWNNGKRSFGGLEEKQRLMMKGNLIKDNVTKKDTTKCRDNKIGLLASDNEESTIIIDVNAINDDNFTIDVDEDFYTEGEEEKIVAQDVPSSIKLDIDRDSGAKSPGFGAGESDSRGGVFEGRGRSATYDRFLKDESEPIAVNISCKDEEDAKQSFINTVQSESKTINDLSSSSESKYNGRAITARRTGVAESKSSSATTLMVDNNKNINNHDSYNYSSSNNNDNDNDSAVIQESFADELLLPVKDGDIVGCGIDFESNQVFFTKNGKRFPATIDVDIPSNVDFRPVISLNSHCEAVETNFGPNFKFNGPEIEIPSSLESKTFEESNCAEESKASHIEDLEDLDVNTLKTALDESAIELDFTSVNENFTSIDDTVVDIQKENESYILNSKVNADNDAEERNLTGPEMDALYATMWPMFELIFALSIKFKPNKIMELQSKAEKWNLKDEVRDDQSSNNLQKNNFKIIIEQLQMCYDILKDEAEESVGGIEPIKVEAITFRYLILLFSTVDFINSDISSDSSFLGCLYGLLNCGSPRIQRIILRVFRVILKNISPEIADSSLAEFFSLQDSKSKPDFVTWILDRMSSALGKACGLPLGMFEEDEVNKSLSQIGQKYGIFATSSGYGSGHANMTIVCEEACLLRSMLSMDNWKDIAWDKMLESIHSTSSYFSYAESANDRQMYMISSKSMLHGLASTYVIGDNDMLRIGGHVEKISHGGTERYTVIEFSRGANEVIVLDGNKINNNKSSLPYSSFHSGSIVPVPEVMTPKFPDEVVKKMLIALHHLITSCSRTEISAGGLLLVAQARIRTLSVSAFRTLLMQFSCAWKEPTIPHIASILFSYALKPIPLPFCPATSKLEAKIQFVKERILESTCLGSNYLKSIPEEFRELSTNTEDETMLYRVVLKEGAIVREGIAIDDSEQVRVLKVGTIVEVLEQCISSEGILRFRIKDGWISNRCQGGSEDVIVERVSKAMSEDIIVERDDIIEPKDVPAKGIKHRLHDSPLRLMQPTDLFSDAAGWECDHCEVSFSPHEYAFVSTSPSKNWALCHNCFCSDSRAVAVAKGSKNAQDEAETELLRLTQEKAMAVAAHKEEEIDRMRDEAEAKVSQNVTITRIAVTQLCEMGFLEDQVRAALAVAIPVAGSASLDNLEQIIEQTIEYLTTGIPDPPEIDDDMDDDDDDDDDDDMDDDDMDDDDMDDEEKTIDLDDEKTVPDVIFPPLPRPAPYATADPKETPKSISESSEAFSIAEITDTIDIDQIMLKYGASKSDKVKVWRDSEDKKIEKTNSLASITNFSRAICRSILEINAGHVEASKEWIQNNGFSYLPDGGRNSSIYPSVFMALGFKANVKTTVEKAISVHEIHSGEGEEDILEEGAIMQKLSARMGTSDAEESLLYESNNANGLGEHENIQPNELAIEEAILEKLETEKVSKMHKVIVGLVCTRCQYLEFPGCSQHSQLLSIRKPNGHGKCARCSCATDLHSPWDKGCRVCRKPTKKYFFAMTVRETQFLLHGFPSKSRTSNDDTCEVNMLHCACCNVVGFPGIGGVYPSVCVKTKDGPFTVGATGEQLPADTWNHALQHIGACPNAGKSLDEVLVRVSYSEAKYLHKTAANVDTFAKYTVRAKGLSSGMIMAINEEEGPINMLTGRVGVARSFGNRESDNADNNNLTVDLYDEERGFSVSHTFKVSEARMVTNMFGHPLESDGMNAMRRLAIGTDYMLTSRYAREAIVWMISHWSPQHPPTLLSLGISNWQPLLQVFKLVGLSDRSASNNPKENDSLTTVLPKTTLDNLESNLAVQSEGKSSSLAAVLKHQFIMWMKTISSDSKLSMENYSLFQALLSDSLQNLYSIALGENLNSLVSYSSLNDISHPDIGSCSSALLGPASGAGSLERSVSACSTASTIGTPGKQTLVRQCLHPYVTPTFHGETVSIPDAQGLRITLDSRCSFGKNASSLTFWRSEADAKSGAEPIKRLPSKSWSSLSASQNLSFVVPNSDSMYYTFETKKEMQDLSHCKVELEPTNFCKGDYTIENGIVRCSGGFPSIAPKDIFLRSGKWYYEVTLVKAGLAQIGWGDSMFSGNSLKGEGVGDDLHSWGLDGHRIFKWHGGGIRWGRAWVEGDVIGFAADLTKRTLSYSLNGSFEAPMGIAFEDISFVEGIRPCLTLNKSCAFMVNFGEEPFKNAPAGYEPIIKSPRDHIMKQFYWGYRFEVAPCIGLQTRPVCDFRLLWKSSSQGNRRGASTTIWRAKVRPGCAILGDVAVSGPHKPDVTLVVVDDDNPLLKYPTGYTKIMNLDTPSESNGTIWRPIAPEGFVAMGDIFTLGHVEPSVSLCRCVRKDAVEPAALYYRIKVWKESQSLFNVLEQKKNTSMWAVGNQIKSFVVSSGFNTPFSSDFKEQGWAIKGAPSGNLQNSWHSEGEACRQPSMEWALWILDCFLENVPPSVLHGRGGILTSQTYEALIKCIVDSHCTEYTRTQAASLLTRLLRTKRNQMLKSADNSMSLPYFVRSLGKIAGDLLKFCRNVGKGRLCLQKDLQQIVELVTTVHWISPQSLVSLRAFKGPGIHKDCISDLQQLDFNHGQTSPAILSHLKKVAKSERFSDETALVDLMEMAEFFYNQKDKIGIPFCGTCLRAWLDTSGSSKVIESIHPLPAGVTKNQEGVIEVEGADILEIIFDKRCMLASNSALHIKAVEPFNGSDLNWKATGSKTEPSDLWEARLIVKGPSLTWKLTYDDNGDNDNNNTDYMGKEAWGFGLVVIGRKLSSGIRLKKLISGLNDSTNSTDFSDWKWDYDAAIVAWVNHQLDSTSKSSLEISPFDFRPNANDVNSFSFQCLENVPLEQIYLRISMIQGFNRNLKRVLSLIDIGSVCKHSIGFKLRELSHCIFRDVKLAVLDTAKERTQGSGGSNMTITLDNFSASRSMEANEKDIKTSRCIFSQAFRALHHKDAKILRSCWDGDRVFQVTFRGENGSDAGGVFREGMSRIVEDLFSNTLNLLIPCPNAQHELPNNIDKFIPNPKFACNSLALDMYEFMGKMLGVSLRANLCLPFQIPSFIWKWLLGQEVTIKEMEAVDLLTVKLIDNIRNCTDEAEFLHQFGDSLFFVCTGWDGNEVELFPGASTEIVTFDNCIRYTDLLLEYSLHAFDAQLAAVARGLFAIVPRNALLLLTWHELEVLCCGCPLFDMDFWKLHTTYSGYTEDDKVIKLFWIVLESLSHDEQSGFVRFAWGRSRLPPKNSWFKDMQISRRNTGEESLPVSHTCFFSIELPPYSTEASMRRGLLTAIHFGMAGILNT